MSNTIKQRNYNTTSFNNVVFGTTTEAEIASETGNVKISNLSLKITLDPLLTNPTSGNGYINWVDNIGHALIEELTFKIGNKEIYSSFPYGLWLDIYNELNDPYMKEWSLIGKNSSTDGLKKI